MINPATRTSTKPSSDDTCGACGASHGTPQLGLVTLPRRWPCCQVLGRQLHLLGRASARGDAHQPYVGVCVSTHPARAWDLMPWRPPHPDLQGLSEDMKAFKADRTKKVGCDHRQPCPWETLSQHALPAQIDHLREVLRSSEMFAKIPLIAYPLDPRTGERIVFALQMGRKREGANLSPTRFHLTRSKSHQRGPGEGTHFQGVCVCVCVCVCGEGGWVSACMPSALTLPDRCCRGLAFLACAVCTAALELDAAHQPGPVRDHFQERGRPAAGRCGDGPKAGAKLHKGTMAGAGFAGPACLASDSADGPAAETRESGFAPDAVQLPCRELVCGHCGTRGELPSHGGSPLPLRRQHSGAALRFLC